MPRRFGILQEEVHHVNRGDSAFILYVSYGPLLHGEYVLDSTLFDRRTLAPIWTHSRSPSLSVEIVFSVDSITWYVTERGVARQSGGARTPRSGYDAGSVRLLVRALKNPAALVGKVVKVPFVNLPGFDTDAFFETYMAVAPADSFSLAGTRLRNAWAIQLGTIADNTFFVDRSTHELLGWESGPYEGTCPLLYIRSR